ncbi:hypothetical protein PDE_02819 [Penicillium oxalicum 114-2]|uniref:DUF726 domain-containing protein n=1 Tax=Penicillium oxalicum (strain 114-2 / CGMCC 5302) TaxID=933388 RepID=S7ZBD3_PENO1|nr:hypothetical protein PDE_02819 [Penicillium oxalicum 114-2]
MSSEAPTDSVSDVRVVSSPTVSPATSSSPVTEKPSSQDAGREEGPAEGKKPMGGDTPGKNLGQASLSAPEEVDDFGLPIRTRPNPPRSPAAVPEDAIQPPETAPDAVTPTENEANLKGVADTKAANNQADHKTETEPVDNERSTASTQTSSGNEHPQKPIAHDEQPPKREADPPPPYAKNVQPSEWSHQSMALPTKTAAAHEDQHEEDEEDEWKAMPALGEMDYYDDYGRLIARGAQEKEEDDEAVYSGLGGAGKGYTRVQLDEDAQSATSMDEDTSYLFRDAAGNSAGFVGEELRDTMSQLQATKDFLNETQKIAYVGVVRLIIHEMNMELGKLPTTKATRKVILKAQDAQRKWGQMMMGRLYMHMEISSAEQIMIEQLAEHGVQPGDLIRPLMSNARVKNPMAEHHLEKSSASLSSTAFRKETRHHQSTESDASDSDSPPAYEAHLDDQAVPEVHTPSQLPTSEKIDIDLRWTVLCDLFLILIADAAYDARSRALLERVGAVMDITWLQISRFEKRVTDALEMQEQAEKETWDESEHMEKRRKANLTSKYMIMGLATVGGGLVIGLSAGLLAPVIGAGLAAGLTTVGLSGTSAFLGGVGGTALIASGATIGGSAIGMKASNRRTGAVQTFEYRPLHNNKKLNLIVTVSGWMTGKVDDVRLPYSTVDPIMGDLYSVLWEPEMLRSMGDTINILATEALTQGLQQVLGSTILMALMASIQLPLVLTKLAYLIDNPWNVSLARANAAGLVLADSLQDRNLGNRPVTLLGFSLGARVIFSCLKELAAKGAHGLVQNVYLFGSPVVASKDEYLKARSVISGQFVNGYSKNDWILGYLFRATSGGIMRVSGLAPIEGIPGLKNVDLTDTVNGHMDYRAAMPRILRKVGWEVLEDEFAEIEDPDPDNHAERQRELIREIDEARRNAEQKPEKKRFGLFKRGKMAEKKTWETYDVSRSGASQQHSPDPGSAPGSVLFDIEAIRAELASEAIEVKQLESTLPPMKLDLTSSLESSPHQSTTSLGKLPTSKDTAPPALPRTVSEPPPTGGTRTARTMSDDGQLNEHDSTNMTFDTSFEHAPKNTADLPSTRPSLRSSSTLPMGIGATAVGAMAMEPNAWADNDHDESEISMTFE